ncbi:ShlB/FhaC/HecB family hemolysin secretion/activation protein [Salmonella enterica subsp. enterica serovar Newport]|nr:ShlB/FhaC/HecB family hemolysin secretion/activation protein [Salmonella enterica subsp. enterica serovar Newport]
MLKKISPLALLMSSAVWAAPAPAPSAGSLGNQLRQEAPAPVVPLSAAPLLLPEDEKGSLRSPGESRTRITLNKVVFSGDTAIPGVTEARLQQVVQPWVGKSVSFAGMQAMTQAVTQFYRQQGILLGRAVLPPQTIKNGVLTVNIVAGRYDTSAIHNATSLRDSVVQRIVSSTTPSGEVVRRGKLERVALLLSEIPGVNARVALQAGEKTGTSALDIHLEPGRQFGGYAGMDNQGDATTGRGRVMLGGYANNLLGLGDQLRIDVMDAYERSDLFNGSLDYSALVGGYGTRLGAGYSHLNYHYTFQGLGFNGYSDNWMVYASQPWIRTPTAHIDVRLEGGQQYLTDKYPSSFFGGVLAAEGRKRVSLGGISLAGSAATTPGGVSGVSVRGTVGQMDYRTEAARITGSSDETGTAGEFARLSYQFNHDQQVRGPLSFYTSLTGQMASHNLDTSQKFLLGGPGAVRAYDSGDGAVDEGNIVTAELRSRWSIPVRYWPGASPELTVAAFYDQGWGQQYKDNRVRGSAGAVHLTDSNRVNLAGSGLYATVADAGNYALTMTWARRTGDVDPVSGHDDRDRFWVSAVKTF